MREKDRCCCCPEEGDEVGAAEYTRRYHQAPNAATPPETPTTNQSLGFCFLACGVLLTPSGVLLLPLAVDPDPGAGLVGYWRDELVAKSRDDEEDEYRPGTCCVCVNKLASLRLTINEG